MGALVESDIRLERVKLLNIGRLPGQYRALIIEKIFDLNATEASSVLTCRGDWNTPLHSINPTKKI